MRVLAACLLLFLVGVDSQRVPEEDTRSSAPRVRRRRRLVGQPRESSCVAFHAFHKSAGFTVIKTFFKEPPVGFNMTTKDWRAACQKGACQVRCTRASSSNPAATTTTAAATTTTTTIPAAATATTAATTTIATTATTAATTTTIRTATTSR